MRKTRLSIALMTALLSVGTLSGCDNEYVRQSSEGVLISYNLDGKRQDITAETIFAEYYNDSDKYQSIFDAIKSIIVKNYFSVKNKFGDEYGIEQVKLPNSNKTKVLGYAQLGELETEAQRKVDSDKRQARINHQNNDTTYDKEFEAILTSKGVETEEELYNKYLDQAKVEKFDENYYTYNIEEIKSGFDATGTSNAGLDADTKTELSDLWSGYFKEMLPYHVSHILVKLEDGSATNYYNGTISKENCEKLYMVYNALANGTDTFQVIANDRSDDEGSAAKHGDLGIMDYSTGFVNEFKLGIYAYENLFGKQTGLGKISMPTGVGDSYKLEAKKSFNDDEIPTVDAGVFEKLFKARDITSINIADDKDNIENGEEVMENNTLVYPRNVIYNQYLNRHSFAFVTKKVPTNNETLDTTKEGTTGFHKYTPTENIKLSTKDPILSTVVAGVVRPIIMVRAGTSDYQGIHFIVVNRGAFDETLNGVSMSDYYTTYHYDQDAYPTNNTGKLQTYVNFNGLADTESNSRADSLVSTLKSFNSDKLSKFIFKKYMAKENLVINDKNLEDALNRWIDNSIASSDRETEKSWKNTWTDYVGTIRKQNESRKQLKSQACRIGFDKGTESWITLADFKSYLNGDAFSLMSNEEKALAIQEVAKQAVTNKATGAKLSATDVAKITVANLYDDTPVVDLTTILGGASVKIENIYNEKGALCNDGKAHK